jgi:HEPN domain-containing protein
MTKEQKFKKEYAHELLRIAEGDLETTKILFAATTGRKENTCFNAQQVIEKSIKAVLCYHEIPVPFTHNLDILMDRLPNHLQLTEAEGINELSEYATIRRYEEGTFELDHDDLLTAVKLAETTLIWARKNCK